MVQTEYITLEEIQDYTKTIYNNVDTEPSLDTINEWIANANQKINQDTGRDWGDQEYTQTLLAGCYTLLRNTPVLSITSVKDSDNKDVDYIQDEANPSFVTAENDSVITYQAGFSPMRISAKYLARSYVLGDLVQSSSTTSGNTEKIKVGPIEIVKRIGISNVTNLDSSIEKYENDLRRLVR